MKQTDNKTIARARRSVAEESCAWVGSIPLVDCLQIDGVGHCFTMVPRVGSGQIKLMSIVIYSCSNCYTIEVIM